MSDDHRSCGAAAALLALMMVAPVTVPAEEGAATGPSLYERLGGLMPISVVVSDLLDALVPDPILNRNPAVDAARHRVRAEYLKFQVTAMVCQATGGPCQYTGRPMKESHAHLNITDREWDRMVSLFKEVLAKHQVPDAESQELLAIVGSTEPDIVSIRAMGAVSGSAD